MSAPDGRVRPDSGFALALMLLVTLVVSGMAAAAVYIGMGSVVITRSHERQDLLEMVAEDGLELARARINADRSLFPEEGYTTLEDNVEVYDVEGNVIPGVRRSTYVGPTGITSGEYGVYGSIVTVVRDEGRGVVVRRTQVQQESFSKYAYFTDFEPSEIAFGGGDQIYGPVHSNDSIKIYDSGATFHNMVTTAKVIKGREYGEFREGYRERVPQIPLPQTADLQKLKVQGEAGGTAFTASKNNPVGRATMRIEFVAIDLNGDGLVTGENEGFIRVYEVTSSSHRDWLVAAAPPANLRNSRNCGHFHNGVFVSAADHPENGNDNWMAALSSQGHRCFLGGDPVLFNGFTPTDSRGRWLKWSGPVSPLLNGRPDREYLFPITRALNPSFKGVIFVDGDVAISGTVRGRVTVAATGNIVIADDIVYATDPSVGNCADILGLYAGNNVVVANTPINAPWQRGNGSAYFSYDDTPDEFIHAFVLALNQFMVEGYDSGSTKDERCGNRNWGRGCLYLTGGIIQRSRGPVGTTTGTGYLKRYSYDKCGISDPPPYFPTTGFFARSFYYEVDPTGFDIDEYFSKLAAGS